MRVEVEQGLASLRCREARQPHDDKRLKPRKRDLEGFAELLRGPSLQISARGIERSAGLVRSGIGSEISFLNLGCFGDKCVHLIGRNR